MRKMTAVTALLVMSVFISGCGATVWLKSRGSKTQFVNDVAVCARQSGLEHQEPYALSPNPFVGVELLNLEASKKYEKCMNGKGYTKEK